jgi:hypothetical protein
MLFNYVSLLVLSHSPASYIGYKETQQTPRLGWASDRWISNELIDFSSELIDSRGGTRKAQDEYKGT